MAYADEGVGAPILLIHGWAAHGGFFQDLAARLARGRRVLTLTLRGHLGSEAGQAPLTIETLGEDIAEFVEALDLKAVTALGWSMGAMALWSAAARLEGRLEAIIVEEMAPKLTNDSDWRVGLAGGYGASDVAATLAEIEADWPAYVTRFAPRMFAPDARAAKPELIEWARAEMSNNDARAMASYWASMAAQDFRGRLPAIETPMLVLHGAESQVYPDGATAFVASAAPHGAHVSIPGAGHVPHLEAPDFFFQQIEAFTRTTRRPETRSGGASP
ncbi:MAG TPA: alpha/beta hydrolase [Terricaulis sp.]|nr:alpha/beta hydrolase [Terricaulis sp.]